jgi:uncharacterized protein (TIGR02302 family)
MTPSSRDTKQTRRIAAAIGRTRLAMALERATRAFWPLGSLLLAVWALLAFGLGEWLGRPQLLAALGLVGIAALALAGLGAWRFRWPRRSEALARVDATLPGRPLAALEDEVALGRDDPGAVGVWTAHRERMAEVARAARAVAPDLRLASRDPWALRLVALALALTALVFARNDAVEGISAAFVPAGDAAVASGPAYEAWAEPPAYTGLPTLYLPQVGGDRPLSVPQGTEITVRAYGAAEDFALSQSVAQAGLPGLAAAAEGIATARFKVERDGSVALRRGEQTLGAWSFLMRADAPPEIELTGPVSRAVTGAMQLTYAARDDYGVAEAWAEIELDLPRVDRRYGLAADPAEQPTLEIELPLPVTGDAREIEEMLVEDHSKHPLAGLPVRITLGARDASGQIGLQDGIAAELPMRRFFDPLAAGLVEQRRDLIWAPDANARRVTQVLRALTHRPEQVFDSPRAYLLTRSAIRRLLQAREADALDAARVGEVAETLWQAALLIEDGGLGDAAERLARAQERLREALEGDATDEEIAQLMEELRDATRDYMEQLAQEAIERGQMETAENADPSQMMNQDQIQQLMDRIQELSEQGRRAEAEALRQMLQQMLENMEMRMVQGGSGEGQQSQGQQMMEDLADTLREQQDLADESFQQLQREFREGRQGGQQGEQFGQQQGQPGQGQQRPGGQQPGEPGPGQLAERQEALRQLLDELQGRMPGARGEAGEAARGALDEAERQMGDARDRLQEGDTSGALDRQAEVIENLREGMRQMSEEMRQAQQGDALQPGSEGGDGMADSRSDPLGRPLGARGSLGTNESMLPDADAIARGRELLDEIRRRAGDQTRPDLELDYLRRLLERF